MVRRRPTAPMAPSTAPLLERFQDRSVVRTKRLLREFDDCRRAEADCSRCSSMLLRAPAHAPAVIIDAILPPRRKKRSGFCPKHPVLGPS
jgi:hypothetical protein